MPYGVSRSWGKFNELTDTDREFLSVYSTYSANVVNL